MGKEKADKELKAEVKEELLKKLVTKEEFYGELRVLRLDLEKSIDRVEADLSKRSFRGALENGVFLEVRI